MKVTTLDDAYRSQWQRRWDALHAARFANDFDVAALAAEIRGEFPAGESGDLQFAVWVKKNLRNGAKPNRLLAFAVAFATFDRHAWHRLGGWRGINFLQGLSMNGRYKVINSLHGPGPFHITTIRRRAYKLGVHSKRGGGRDTRTRSESRVDTLRRFIVKLYKQHPELPPLPSDVQAAITPTILSLLGAEASAS